MGTFAVFNQLEWKPPLRSSLLTAPVLKIDVRFDDVELKDMPDKQRKAFDESFKKFDPEFHKLGTQKIKDVQDAVTWTEERIKAKPAGPERTEVVATANKMLGQAFQVFQNQLQTLAQKHYEGSIAKSEQVMKRKIVKKNVKAAVKITVVIGFTLTAAGVKVGAAVAGAVVSHGVGGPSAGWVAFKTTIGTGKTIYRSVMNGLPTLANQMRLIEEDMKQLKGAVDQLDKQNALRGAQPAAITRINQLEVVVKNRFVEIDKHTGQLDKFVFQIQQQIKSQSEKWLAVSAQAAVDPAMKKKAEQLDRKTDIALDTLAAVAKLRAAAQEVSTNWQNSSAGVLPDLGRLEPVSKIAFQAVSALKELSTLGDDLGKAGDAAVKANV